MANEHNLIPATKGEVRNPKGKAKGVKNWSTIVHNLLADEAFAEKIVTKKPGWWDLLPNKNMGNVIATAMIIKAMGGDKNAAEWVRKTGYGDKMVIDFEEGLFTETKMTITVVKAKDVNSDKPDAERETGDSLESAE